MTVWRTRSPSKGAISISAMASNMILSSRAPLQAPGRSCRQSPFCKFAVKQASMRIRVWRASSCFSYQASASQSMTLGSFIDEPGILVANQYGKFPATLGFVGLRARGHYTLSLRRKWTPVPREPVHRSGCEDLCELSQVVAGGAARSAAHSHCKQRSEAIHTCWQSTRIHLFLAQANMTETAPHFRFGFQHCRAGVRTLSGAGMGLSETPELIATHNALCFSSWRGHMPPVTSSYSQQSSHQRVSGRSCSRALCSLRAPNHLNM